jgi:hypothetical protein
MVKHSTSQGGWFQAVFDRWFSTLTRLPGGLVPPAIGATLLFFMTVMRGVFLLFGAPADPRTFLTFLGALVVATAAGALAGAAYVVIRAPLRRLSFIGDLLTGPILGCVYMFVILVPAKYLFQDDTLQTKEDWLTAAAFGAGFGLFGTILYWYHSWRFKKGL